MHANKCLDDDDMRFSPSQTWQDSQHRKHDKPRVGFEPVRNLSSRLVEWSYAVAKTSIPRHHDWFPNSGLLLIKCQFLLPECDSNYRGDFALSCSYIKIILWLDVNRQDFKDEQYISVLDFSINSLWPYLSRHRFKTKRFLWKSDFQNVKPLSLHIWFSNIQPRWKKVIFILDKINSCLTKLNFI